MQEPPKVESRLYFVSLEARLAKRASNIIAPIAHPHHTAFARQIRTP